MSFEDLPQNWPELPLHEQQHAADVVDLLIPMRDRVRNSLLLLPADADGIPFPTPMLFADCDWRDDPSPAVTMWAHMPAEFRSVVIASSHREPGCPGQQRAWLTRLRNGLQAHGTQVLGCFVAASDGVHRAT